MILKILISFFLIGAINFSFSQVDTVIVDENEAIEELIDNSEIESEGDEIFGALEELRRNPIDVNSATLDELQKIPLMDLLNATLIVEHRKRFGDFFSINELFMVVGIDIELVNKILPFVKTGAVSFDMNFEDPVVRRRSFFDDLKINFRQRGQTDLQTRSGFLDDKFQGTKLKSYSRVLADWKDFSAGALIEKDAGEKSFTDFNSFFVSADDFYFLKRIIVGDFQTEFGQGLVLWSPFSSSKSSDAVSPIIRRSKNIFPYRSTDENNFFRGIAFSLNYETTRMTFFYSNNFMDANIDSLTNQITSTPFDGFHRTQSELRNKNSAREKLIGSNLFVDINSLTLGFLVMNSRLSAPLEKTDSPYEPSGDNFTYYSATYSYNIMNINFNGEFAFNGSSVASINSVEIVLNRNFSILNSIRSYPRNFFALHGNPFVESGSQSNNEFGIYSGFKWRTSFGMINFYADFFRFPAPKGTLRLPSTGNEFLFSIRSKPIKALETHLQIKTENKEVLFGENIFREITNRNRTNLRLDFTYTISKNLRSRTRFEINNFKIDGAEEAEKGFLTFQDFRVIVSRDFSIQSRIIFFKTDSFNAAIYEFENDVPGVMTNLPMFGSGMRWYLLVKYELFNVLDFSVKYSETYKPNERTLSSGNSEIFNNLDNRLNLQLDYRF
ncbi:MAG: hypothetical protein C0425_05585 [Chlorobiaceae bacterium]|nr:hypothetical protein [Chlorobiaceae bacterium]MBA4309789.1 hypothetical protein [Chlorobiaceae bacterium]